LVLFGELGPVAALVGFLVIMAGVAILPGNTITVARAVDLPRPVLDDDDNAVFAFADALADPCLVLDRRSVVVHANAAALRQFPAVSNGNPITFSLRNPELVQAIDTVMRNGTVRSIELHETVPSETWDKVVVSPLRQPDRDWLT